MKYSPSSAKTVSITAATVFLCSSSLTDRSGEPRSSPNLAATRSINSSFVICAVSVHRRPVVCQGGRDAERLRDRDLLAPVARPRRDGERIHHGRAVRRGG